MKKILVVFFALMSFIVSVVKGQSNLSDNSGVLFLYKNENANANKFRRGAYVGPHELGDTITWKLNEFEKRYVYYKPGSGAYAVEEKIVEKTPIYKAIKKLSDYFSQQAANQKITEQEASNRLGAVLDVGNKLINYRTEQVEKEVKKIKDPIQLEKYLLSLKFA